MKIIDVPQSGKCGVKVSQGGRYGQVVRALVIPTNPAPQQNKADVTALYVAKFGTPAVGTKIFFSVNQMVAGFEDIPVEWSAIVPA